MTGRNGAQVSLKQLTPSSEKIGHSPLCLSRALAHMCARFSPEIPVGGADAPTLYRRGHTSRVVFLERMKDPCRHTRVRTTVVFLEPTEPGESRQLAISAMCDECEQPFEFVGVEGPGTRLSEDRRELGLTITEGATWRVM